MHASNKQFETPISLVNEVLEKLQKSTSKLIVSKVPRDGIKSKIQLGLKKKNAAEEHATEFQYQQLCEMEQVDCIEDLVVDDKARFTLQPISKPHLFANRSKDTVSLDSNVQYEKPNISITFDNPGEKYYPDNGDNEESEVGDDDDETAYFEENLLQSEEDIYYMDDNVAAALITNPTVKKDVPDDCKPLESKVSVIQPEPTESTTMTQKIKKNKKNLKLTVVKMESPAAYVCMTCKQKFNTFDELKDHMKNNKQCKQMHLTCETCGKVCENKKSLYQHQLTHKEKNTYICDECGKIYTNRFNLENHKSSVHGDRVEEYGSIYKCKVCDDQFTNRTDLYAHIKQHTKLVSLYG